MSKITKNNVVVAAQGEEFEVKSYEFFYSTRKKVNKGKWYFEITHVSGNNLYYIGWWINSVTFMGFSPCGYQSKAYAYFYDPNGYTYSSYINKNGEYVGATQLNFENFTAGQTIGIGVDIDSKLFYYQYQNQHQYIRFRTNSKVNKLKNYFFTSDSGTGNDVLTFNFGSSDFVYQIPDGYIPLNNKYYIKTTCY